jgi:hypothetical protein
VDGAQRLLQKRNRRCRGSGSLNRDVLAAKYRRPDRWFDVAFWHQADIATEPIDVRLREIDAILERCITDPVSPSFMAPPATRPVEHRLSVA